jgi:ABC-type multidrug transport system ATPase subunit
LLDEATSSLDAETEAAINATLGHIAKGRTVIAVTHRLSSVVHADRIFVLDHGRIIEQGRHEKLLALRGLYAQLWQKQTSLVVSENDSHAEEEATRLRVKLRLAMREKPLLGKAARHPLAAGSQRSRL